LRLILMTAFATIMGILPVAIGLGEAAGGRRPLGIAVISGMITSTFLTLVIVPVVYVLIASRRKVDAKELPNPAPAPATAADGSARS